MPQAKSSTPPAPSFGAVEPPKRVRKGSHVVTEEIANALMDALETSSQNGDGWTGDGQTYGSMGKAQAASQRYRRALLDNKIIDNAKRLASRVWQDGDVFRFALRLRSDEEVNKLGATE